MTFPITTKATNIIKTYFINGYNIHIDAYPVFLSHKHRIGIATAMLYDRGQTTRTNDKQT